MRKAEILVVDDHADFRAVFSHFLESRGYAVATSCNGAEALERLESEPDVRLIVLDLAMPVLDGWGFLARREGNSRLRRIPVIVLSAEPDAGPILFSWCVRLHKPVNTDELLATVHRWCGPARRKSSGAVLTAAGAAKQQDSAAQARTSGVMILRRGGEAAGDYATAALAEDPNPGSDRAVAPSER